MDYNRLKKMALNNICRVAVALVCLGAAGCGSSGMYSMLTPAYSLAANQNRKIFIWIESPRSAGADVEAPSALGSALRDRLVAQANVRPENIFLAESDQGALYAPMQTPEAAALAAGAELALLVRIEDYELLPMYVRNYHSGRLLTRAVLLDATTGQTLWPLGPEGQKGKAHDIVVELGQGERSAILQRMVSSTAHCILRDLYPIMKMHYKTSDERVSLQEAFEMETF